MMGIQNPTGGSSQLKSGPQVVRISFLWPSLSLKLPIPALQEQETMQGTRSSPHLCVEQCIVLFFVSDSIASKCCFG